MNNSVRKYFPILSLSMVQLLDKLDLQHIH